MSRRKNFPCRKSLFSFIQNILEGQLLSTKPGEGSRDVADETVGMDSRDNKPQPSHSKQRETILMKSLLPFSCFTNLEGPIAALESSLPLPPAIREAAQICNTETQKVDGGTEKTDTEREGGLMTRRSLPAEHSAHSLHALPRTPNLCSGGLASKGSCPWYAPLEAKQLWLWRRKSHSGGWRVLSGPFASSPWTWSENRGVVPLSLRECWSNHKVLSDGPNSPWWKRVRCSASSPPSAGLEEYPADDGLQGCSSHQCPDSVLGASSTLQSAHWK